MNPAFTAQSLRQFYPVFRRVVALVSCTSPLAHPFSEVSQSSQLAQRWTDKLQEGDPSKPQVMDISRGLANTTLDIIGEGEFCTRVYLGEPHLISRSQLCLTTTSALWTDTLTTTSSPRFSTISCKQSPILPVKLHY